MYEMIRRAMLQLQYNDDWMADADAFEAAVDAVDLEAVTKKTMSNAVYAAVASEAFELARMDYIYACSIEDTYLAAGTGVDCLLFSESDPIACAERAYFNKEAPAEIIELMLIEHGVPRMGRTIPTSLTSRVWASDHTPGGLGS